MNTVHYMFQGSMVAVVTPMGEDGSIDYEALDRLVEFHIAQGSDALVAAGTTGESATLTFDEHCRVIAAVVRRVAGRIPVIAGSGANSTREAIELTRHAGDAGADACLLITPYYNKPTQEGLYRHYKAVAEAVPIPQILYNVPSRTACDVLPETVQRLSELKPIIGIKEATGSLERSRRIMQLCGDDFVVYSGEDAAAAELMLAGAKGVISVTANVAPKKMHEMSVSALAGNRSEAMRVDQELQALHEALFLESNPIPVKWSLCEMGLIAGGIRLPLLPLSEIHHEQVRAAMRQAGVNPE